MSLFLENLNLDIDDDYVELTANSGDYSAFVEDGKVSFSVIYEDEDDRDGFKKLAGIIK
jgi:peroxiredoxin